MLKDPVSFSDFQKLDFRVGKVLEAVFKEGSVNLIRMKVDLGSDYGVRTIFAGVAKWYTPEDLVDKQFVFVANLTPKKMMDEESQGMMLAADGGEKAILLPVSNDVRLGSIVR